MKNFVLEKMRRGVSAYVALVAAVMLMLAASCSKNSSADLNDLLTTVPGDAVGVCVINTESMLKKADCKVSGSGVEMSGEMKEALGKISDRKKAAFIEGALNGDAGLAIAPLVGFAEGYNMYVTGLVDDTDKLIAWYEKQSGAKREVKGDVSLVGDLAVSGNQFWLALMPNYVNPEDVSRFLSLSEDQSVLSRPYGEQLAEMDYDIRAWGAIDGMLNLSGKSSDMMGMRLAMGSLFEDAKDFGFTVDFKKGVAEVKGGLYNSKGDVAKFLLPTEKIDVATVKLLGEKADMVGAMAVNQKFVKKVADLAKSFGGALPADYLSMIQPVDGTICFDNGMTSSNKMNVIVTTTGEGTSALSTMLGSFGSVVKDGKLLKVINEGISGELTVADAADGMKDAMLGVVASGKAIGNGKDAAKVSDVVFTLSPSGNGLSVALKINCKDSGKNSLLQLL